MSRLENAFAITRFLGRNFVLKPYNCEYPDLSGIAAPYILLSNHTTDGDPFLIGLAAKRPIHFVASEHMSRQGLIGWWVMNFLEPILHQKGKQGLATTKAMIKAVKNGACVGLFPEGGRSFSGETEELLSNTSKLVKALKTTLVTVKIVGGYEIQPRWGVKQSKTGHLKLELSGVYSPEEIKSMSDDELMDLIKRDLYVKAELPEDLTGIESTLFLAGKEDVGPGNNIPELCKAQREYIFEGKGDFCDECQLYEVNKRHKAKFSGNIILTANEKGFAIDGNPIIIDGMGMVSRNTIVFFSDEKHYEIRGGEKFNGLKYYLQYQYLNQKEKEGK